MKKYFSQEEEALLELLKVSLNKRRFSYKNISSKMEYIDWRKLFFIAEKHAVLSFLYGTLSISPILSKENKEYLARQSRRVVVQSYGLFFLTKYLVELFEKNQIPVVVLKGVATAGLYPEPELRKSGDVDILLVTEVDEKKLQQIMAQSGFSVAEVQHANHHIAFVSSNGIEIEVHTMVSEPFSYERINQYLADNQQLFQKHYKYMDIMEVSVPVLEDPYHAFQLLLHMLQHFLYAGFGLKLLCDWVIIWNKDWNKEDIKTFEKLISESGIRKFAELITSVCVRYLGLHSENVEFMLDENALAEEFMFEILEAEEFGKSAEERMVMLRSTKWYDYIREFHHQMQLNFPKEGKIFICWPVLWMITLIRFVRNNRKLRRVSTMAVLKKAGTRSKIMDRIRLFEKE